MQLPSPPLPSRAEGLNRRLLRQLADFVELVKFEHTIFALPYAYGGAFLAARGFPGWHDFFWITMAMVGARTAAMTLNRLIDRAIDAANPRTKNRSLPAGKVSAGQAYWYVIISFALLLGSAWQLNLLCIKLLPIAIVVLVTYSYTKRFTWLCHLVLGIADSAAPLGAWIAVTATVPTNALILAAIVALWIGGFDIIYALPDREFDLKEGLHSIPVRFGPEKALWISRAWHLLTVFLGLWLYHRMGLGPFFLAGIIATAALLAYEHHLVSPRDWSRVNMAFFNVNGIISVIFLVSVLLDVGI